MNIHFPYGTGDLPVDVPDNWINGRCYRSFRFEPSPNSEEALDDALMEPIGGEPFQKVVKNKKSAVLVVDSSCPQLFRSVLPSFLARLEEQSGLTPDAITILFTNSTWNTLGQDFLTQYVPGPILSRYKTILHDPFDHSQMVPVGVINDQIPLRVNVAYHEAELRLVLGPVMPDLITGFTGGRSNILPGIVDDITVRALYTYQAIGKDNVGYGITRDNPFNLAGMMAVQQAGCDFSVCVLMTAEGEISEFVCGDAGQSTMAAIEKMREKLGVTLKEPMDIVITTGGGAPYDRTLYHAISVVSAMLPILKEDGTIVIISAMDKGFGPDPLRELLLTMRSPARFKDAFSSNEEFQPGQWVAQRLFDILSKHEVICYSEGIPEQELWQAGLTPTKNVQDAIEVAMQGHGQRCKICALPEGPFSIPILKVAAMK